MRRLARAACVSTGAAAVLLCGSGAPAAADSGWGSPWEVPSDWEVPRSVGDPGVPGQWGDPWDWSADASDPDEPVDDVSQGWRVERRSGWPLAHRPPEYYW